MTTPVTTLAQARAISHSLSKPSKMPCFGYSLPAARCKIGSLLRKVKGPVCNVCYALKGHYVFPVVLAAMETRFKSLDDPQWVEAMAFQINFYRKKSKYFRWHDSERCRSKVPFLFERRKSAIN